MEAKARKNRLELTFTEPVNADSIKKDSFAASAWNYRGGPKVMVLQPLRFLILRFAEMISFRSNPSIFRMTVKSS